MRRRARVARRPRPALAAALALVSALLFLSGCSTALGRQYAAGDQKNFVSGDGTVQQTPAAERDAPVELTGRAADGSRIDVARWRGKVVVVNVWYAACAPCRAEAPGLAQVAAANPDVPFVGINTHDSASVVQAFDRRYTMPYPSILDARSGAALLSLRGTLPPAATPSTVVLDGRGRPAARVVGRVDPTTLQGLIDDAGKSA